MGKLIHWGRLLRLSMGPSAAADAQAGILLGAGLWPAGTAPWTLILGSLAVYHGGMALNDWSDRHQDAKTRPERPIPSAQISAGAALLVALLLLIGGPLLVGWQHTSAGWALGAVALCATLYDTLGRGPWLGPCLLGLCRAGNMSAGVWLGLDGSEFHGLQLALPLLYGLYVFFVSRLGRMEDGQDKIAGGRLNPRTLILLSALLLSAPGLFPGSAAHPISSWARAGAILIGLAGAKGLIQAALSRNAWQPADIIPVMGMALRRLLLFSAAVALIGGGEALFFGWPVGLFAALVILAGYPLSHRLRGIFPPS